VCCQDCDDKKNDKKEKQDSTAIIIGQDECAKGVLNSNDFLRSIHIEIASACSERCVHCYTIFYFITNSQKTLIDKILKEFDGIFFQCFKINSYKNIL